MIRVTLEYPNGYTKDVTLKSITLDEPPWAQVLNVEGNVHTILRGSRPGGHLGALGSWIADVNESYNVDGLEIAGEQISNEQLRQALPDNVEEWTEDHMGQTFRRPAGKVLYTVIGCELNFSFGNGHIGTVVIVRRSSDGKTTAMGAAELEAMMVVP